jgi:hypothetical protein
VVIVSKLEAFDVGRLSCSMYFRHVACVIRVCVVGFWGSLWCSWDARSVRVAARVDRSVPSLLVGRDLSPLYSFACIVVALSMWNRVCPCGVIRFSNNVVQYLTPSFHMGPCV